MDLEIVRPDEKAKYNDFCVKLVTPFVSLPPEVIWHYTNGASLISILKTGTLYSTQISCLNDSREFRHVRDLFAEAVKAQNPGVNDNAKYLIDLLNSGLQRDTVHFDAWFITCFSSKRDDLSQWRAYGNGENGYAIGLISSWLRECGKAHGSLLIPVCYDLQKTRNFVADLAQATIRFFLQGIDDRPGVDREKWARSFLKEWGEQIEHFQPLFKDPAFKDESEWRLIHRLTATETSAMEYVQKPSMLSRHLPLRFPPPGKPDARLLPIQEVMIGPGRHKEVSRISVGDLLRTCGYQSVEVTVSSVPYQSA
ncbi:MAG: DUF2971 domain-containing protein [Rhodospirillales bacterium]|nr:DUF2971 domain-containing protein [Rhodospirillales bacterium]